MNLSYCRLPEIKSYFQTNHHALIVIGSCEQHGSHLPYGTDHHIPQAIAQRVAKFTRIILVPFIPFGLSDCHMGFPGTISLRGSTFYSLLEDIVMSLSKHGCLECLLVNGHGGNTPVLKDLCRNLQNKITLHIVEWWNIPGNIELIHSAFNGIEYHADAAETSLMLYISAESVKMEHAFAHSLQVDSLFPTKDEFLKWYPQGAVGFDPKYATSKLGEILFENTVQYCLKLCGLESTHIKEE